MNLSSEAWKLHCILIIHVKGYLQTRTTEQSRFSFVHGNAITLPPAISRNEQSNFSMLARKTGKPAARTHGPTTVASIVGITTREDDWALRIWNVIEGRARYRRPHAPARHGDAFIAGVYLFLPSFVNVAAAHSTWLVTVRSKHFTRIYLTERTRHD